MSHVLFRIDETNLASWFFTPDHQVRVAAMRNVNKLRTDEHGTVPLLSKEGTQENDAKHVLLRGWLAANIGSAIYTRPQPTGLAMLADLILNRNKSSHNHQPPPMKNVLRIVFHRPLLEKEGNLIAELQTPLT